MQKLIMKMSSLVDHEKAQSLPFQIKFISCKSGEYFLSYALTIFLRFLLGTGRMPHPVGGAMGVTVCHCRASRETRFDIYYNS